MTFLRFCRVSLGPPIFYSSKAGIMQINQGGPAHIEICWKWVSFMEVSATATNGTKIVEKWWWLWWNLAQPKVMQSHPLSTMKVILMLTAPLTSVWWTSVKSKRLVRQMTTSRSSLTCATYLSYKKTMIKKAMSLDKSSRKWQMVKLISLGLVSSILSIK